MKGDEGRELGDSTKHGQKERRKALQKNSRKGRGPKGEKTFGRAARPGKNSSFWTVT